MNIAGMNIAGMNTVDQRAEILRRDAEPYVMVLVVRCESPTSAKPGARGVVDREGVITGWIGGGCAQPIVIEESRRALREGTPRLVRITPEAGQAEVNGLVTYEMVCHSGGTMDIFIEPVLPPPQLVILGRSPVARTLSRIAAALQAGFGEVIRTALEESKADNPQTQWQLLLPILTEAETPQPETPKPRPGCPRRVARPRPGLTIRREQTRDGYSLHFTGRDASSWLMDDVFGDIERMYGVG